MENVKLLKAKVNLIVNQPFFASLMLRKPFEITKEVKKASTDGKKLKFNPDFIEESSVDELAGVICHELLHITHFHHLRRGNRNVKKWNRACDEAINPLIFASGLTLPDWVLNDPQFAGMPAEKIYKLLPDEDGDGDGEDPGGAGDVEDSPEQGEEQIQEEEGKITQELVQAMTVARMAGKLPGFMEEYITGLIETKVNWKESLARFITDAAHNDYSFSKPNMRFLHTGFILPSLYNIEIGEFVLLVDTSYSVDVEMLNVFASEMQDVVNMTTKPITVLYVDTKVAGEPITIEPGEPLVLNPIGRGGTDFVPGFEWIDENCIAPKFVIYFTDGDCRSFPPEPDYPVMWAISGGRKFHPPFGEVIHID